MSSPRAFLNWALCLGVFFLALFSADRVLGVLGFPEEIREEPVYAYPPNLKAKPKFIRFRYTLETNDKGIRYRRIPEEKPAGESRIAVVGDSFVEGEGVEAEDAFPAVLERRFSARDKKTLFINCGISGAGPDAYESITRHIALSYHPDKVLLFFYANDVMDALLPDEKTGERAIAPRGPFKSLIHRAFPRLYTLARKAFYRIAWAYEDWRDLRRVLSDAAAEARLGGAALERIKEWQKALPKEEIQAMSAGWRPAYRLTDPLLFPRFWVDALDLESDEAKARWKETVQILSKISSVCRDKEVALSLFYVPHPYQYDSHFDPLPEKLGMVVKKKWLSEESELEKRLREWADKEGIPFLSLTSYFREAVRGSAEPLNYGVDIHWTPRGHELAASVISEGLLSPSRRDSPSQNPLRPRSEIPGPSE